MCKHDKSLNTVLQTSYLSSHENALQEQPRRRGSAPYRCSDWTSRLWGCPKNGLLKTTRERRALFSLLSLATLWCSWTRNCALPTRARLTWKPARWTLTTKPTKEVQDRAKAVTPQNNELNNFRGEGSFPGDVTRQRSKPAEFPEQRMELNTWHPKQRTHAGKRNQLRACFKPIQASTNWIPNPDWTGKYDLNAVTKQRFVRDLFLVSQAMK